MTHVPNHPENGCTKCVINLRFMIAILKQLVQRQAALGSLLQTATAADAVYSEAIELKLIVIKPKDWCGCEEAATLAKWLEEGVPGNFQTIAAQWKADIERDLNAFLAE